MKKGLLSACAILVAMMLSFQPVVGQDHSENLSSGANSISCEKEIELDLCDTDRNDNCNAETFTASMV